MRPHSLRLRLILVSALAILVSLTVAGFVLTALFSDHIERAAIRTLTAELNRLAALTDADGDKLDLSQKMSDPRFDVPYGGIYWQVRDPATGEVLRSRSMWDQSFDTSKLALSANGPTTLKLSDPEGSPALGLGRLLSFERVDGAIRPLELIVAEDNAAASAAVASYRMDLFQALAALGVILVISAWAQVVLGLSPLSLIRRGVKAMRTGTAQRLEGDFPSEVQPLVAEVNDLAEAQELAIQFARERAADLAHGLKGYLQVLNAMAHELRLKDRADSAGDIEALTAEMADTIDHQLGLSRLRRRSPHALAATPLDDTVERVVRTLKKTARGTEIEWTIVPMPGATVALDKSDLAELFGALAENATKWARSAVRVTAIAGGATTRLIVEDNGPGLTDVQIAQIGQRGVRLDEKRSGSGIGISIVREIVALNGGKLGFARSELGGLSVSVELPAGVLSH